jgi:hypothetical protein
MEEHKRPKDNPIPIIPIFVIIFLILAVMSYFIWIKPAQNNNLGLGVTNPSCLQVSNVICITSPLFPNYQISWADFPITCNSKGYSLYPNEIFISKQVGLNGEFREVFWNQVCHLQNPSQSIKYCEDYAKNHSLQDPNLLYCNIPGNSGGGSSIYFGVQEIDQGIGINLTPNPITTIGNISLDLNFTDFRYYNKTYVYNKTEINDLLSALNITGGNFTGFNETEGIYIYNSTRYQINFNESRLNMTISNLLDNGTIIRIWNSSWIVSNVGNFSSVNSTLARTGNCPAGYVVQNTTTGGVQCVSMSSGFNVSEFYNVTVAVYDGNMGGYVVANSNCNSEFTGTHVCTFDEIKNSIDNGNQGSFPNGVSAWCANGFPGYTANANDCYGWTSSSTSFLGPFWLFNNTRGGEGWLVSCSATHPLACCK